MMKNPFENEKKNSSLKRKNQKLLKKYYRIGNCKITPEFPKKNQD